MNRTHLRAGLRFKLNNNIYIILKMLSDERVQVSGETFGETIIFTKEELAKKLSEGNLIFEVCDRNIKNSGNEANFKFSIDDLEFQHYRDEVLFRYNVIKPFIMQENIRKSRQDIIKRVEEVNALENNPSLIYEKLQSNFFTKVSTATVYRWIRYYQDSNRDIRALVPGYSKSGGKNKPRLNSKLIEIIDEEINTNYRNEQRLSIQDLYQRISNRVIDINEFSNEKLKAPSYVTVTRYIKNIPEYELIAARYGKKTAESKYRQNNGGIKVCRPFERVEIDGTPLDLIVVDEEGDIIGKPTFILAIDKLTRYPAGFSLSFGHESWKDVMLCIWHILKEKSYVKEKYPNINSEWVAFGVPESIVVDNGLAFKNTAMIDACYQLGIDLQFCPPRTPQWKASVERFFKTSCGIIHSMPGTTRSDRKELGDKENPTKEASITLPLLVMLLHKWIIDIYCQDINRGARGVPYQIWKEEVKFNPVAWPNSTDEFPVLLGKVEYRLVRSTGIELMHQHYNSSELNKLYRKFSAGNKGETTKFKVKYDPYDIDKVYIYDHLFEKRWIEVPSTCHRYTNGLSEWEHKLILKRRKEMVGRVDLDSLIKEKVQLQEDIRNSKKITKRQKAVVEKNNSLTIISDTSEFSKEQSQNETKILSEKLLKQSTKSISDIGSVYLNDTSTIISKEKENTTSSRDNNSTEKIYEEYKNQLRPEDFEGFEIIDS